MDPSLTQHKQESLDFEITYGKGHMSVSLLGFVISGVNLHSIPIGSSETLSNATFSFVI